jgi:hypothetical protein
VTTAAARLEEITITLPISPIVSNDMWIVISIHGNAKGGELKAIFLLGIALGFIQFANHAIIHFYLLLSSHCFVYKKARGAPACLLIGYILLSEPDNRITIFSDPCLYNSRKLAESQLTKTKNNRNIANMQSFPCGQIRQGCSGTP